MKSLTDSTEIFSFLEKENHLPSDFNRTQAFCFTSGNNFILIIYFPKGERKGFEAYEVEDFAENNTDMQELQLLLQDKTEYYSEKEIYSKAALLVQNFLRTLKPGNFFYDEH